MKATIKNIIFDWGGVLIDLDMDNCVKAFNEIGINNFQHLITSAEDTGIFKSYELGNCTTEEFRKGIRELADRAITDAEIDYVWNAMVKTVPTEKLRLLSELRNDYSIFLLSNTNELHWKHASTTAFQYQGLERDDFFKAIFLSFQMHLAKPDPEIFRTAIREANLIPEETLVIDDSLANCKAAASVNLHTAHYIPGTDLRAILP